MTKRNDEPEDETPKPPGGRAAERLRQFKEARLPQDDTCGESEEGLSEEAKVIIEEVSKQNKGGTSDERAKRRSN